MLVRNPSAELVRVPAVDPDSVAFLSRMAGLVPGIIYVFNHKTMSNEYSNRSIAELLGYLPQELIEMGDKIIEQCVHEDDLPDLVKYFASIGDVTDGEYTSFEYRDYTKEGDIVWLRSIDTPFERAPDGSLLRHLGIAFDITAEKTAQLEMVRLNAELEARVAERTRELARLNDELEARVEARTSDLKEANGELERLSYLAAHDLKVPINNMSSLVSMLDEGNGDLPPEHLETIGWMQEVCKQASNKLDALVCVAQAHTDWPEPFTEVDLTAVTERVLDSLHFAVREANASIKYTFSARTVVFLPREVEDILQAVISNALKYRDKSRRLRIQVTSYRQHGDVCVEISDNGSGADLPREADKVFGLFQRAHVAPDGEGVKLYSIRRIMERIGGAIEARGERGKGCTFVLRFPAPVREGKR